VHFYQPYDRASLVAWLLAIWCARAQRFWAFSAVAIVGVLIKFDAIVLPGLYFLGNATSQTWRKYLFQSSVIAIILFVIFEALSLSLGGVWVRPDYVASDITQSQNDGRDSDILPPGFGFWPAHSASYLGVQEQRPIHACKRLVRRNDCGYFDGRVEL